MNGSPLSLNSSVIHTFQVLDDIETKIRIDKYLADKPEIGSRTKAAFLIESERVYINKKLAKSATIVKSGDLIDVYLPPPTPSELIPLNINLDVIYEDESLLVVNKPSGLVVHPAFGHEQDTLVNALLHHTKELSMRFGEQRPGIIHRIDKETSGLLVVAKSDSVHEQLADQFKARSIHRIYEAVCFGEPKPLSGKIESFLARHPTDRKRYASVKVTNKQIGVETGKHAVTNYNVLRTKSMLSLVQLKLETGRTHQIRVHLSEKGHPLVGDNLYGWSRRLPQIKSVTLRNELKNLNRFYLHAKELGFYHPLQKKWMQFKKDWPEIDLEKIQRWMMPQ